MSYSFSVRAATKEAAKARVAEELANVVKYQPIHDADRAQAEAAVGAFIDVLNDEPTKDVAVNVSGSVMSYGGTSIYGATLNVNAYLADRA